MELTVLSHTYVEPENRGKLRELARLGPVTAVIPRRWHERAFHRRWRGTGHGDDGARVVSVSWYGLAHPSLGGMTLPRELCQSAALLQVEEEPWTPSAYLAARRWCGPMIVFTWENLCRSLPPPWSRMHRAVLRRVQGVIAGSHAAAKIVTARGYVGPLEVIPQLGVDLPGVTQVQEPEGRYRLVFVGRLVRGKGVDVLLQAACRLTCPWTLTVVGDGPERPRLVRLARQLGIAEQIAFTGARSRAGVASIWSEADVCVLPSRTTATWAEQFGHVLVEAMAHRVPVVGSTCGAIPEVIGEAGLVFPEGDSVALAAALMTLAGRRDDRWEWGERGRRRVAANFTNERIAVRTHAFHQEVIRRADQC